MSQGLNELLCRFLCIVMIGSQLKVSIYRRNSRTVVWMRAQLSISILGARRSLLKAVEFYADLAVCFVTRQI